MLKTVRRGGQILGLLAVVMFASVSCEKSIVSEESIDALQGMSKVMYIGEPVYCGEPVVVDLTAGQTENVGSVVVGNNDDFLYVTYKANEGEYINEVHLFIDTKPFTSRLAPGRAVYKVEGLYAQEYTFEIPLANFAFEVVCGETMIYLQAHAAMESGETAYGGDITKPKRGSWYGNFGFVFQCCDEDPEPPVVECNEETAFGGSMAVNVGSGGAWFYYFDAAGEASQPIYAGQYIHIGNVSLVDGKIIIELFDFASLQDDEDESVKIGGFNEAPTTRPAGGHLNIYKGTSLIVDVPVYPFYVIHLDAIVCLEEGGGDPVF